MSVTVDLNADLGESFGAWSMGDDGAMLDIVTSSNMACGFHAGDPNVMADTLTKAKSAGVAVGAHPSFYDLYGFGRRIITNEPPESVANAIVYQLGAAQALAKRAGHTITHLRTHGALANLAEADADLTRTIAEAVKQVAPGITFFTMAGSAADKIGPSLGLPVCAQVYADRSYEADGSLTPRSHPDAMIHDPEKAADRLLAMLDASALITRDGEMLPVEIDTICLHGDTPDAVCRAEIVRTRLEQAGVTIAPYTEHG